MVQRRSNKFKQSVKRNDNNDDDYDDDVTGRQHLLSICSVPDTVLNPFHKLLFGPHSNPVRLALLLLFLIYRFKKKHL